MIEEAEVGWEVPSPQKATLFYTLTPRFSITTYQHNFFHQDCQLACGPEENQIVKSTRPEELVRVGAENVVGRSPATQGGNLM